MLEKERGLGNIIVAAASSLNLTDKIFFISTTQFHIVPLSENAMLFYYGNTIDIIINQKIMALHHKLSAMSFPGFIESVPAYASLAVFYNAVFIKQHYPDTVTASAFVQNIIESIAREMDDINVRPTKPIISIPVYYHGEDLEWVASLHQLNITEVIQLHSEVTYHVFMNGFLPGFAYMGTVNEKIITARKDKPRLRVAAGSVGIAGAQTGIYPIDSPGGWQIIGTTPLQLFNKKEADPCIIKAGDQVKFFAIDKNEFDKLNEH